MTMSPSPRSYRALFWTLAILGAAADLGSKYAVFARLPVAPHPDYEYAIIKDVFSLIHPAHLNHGALFGIGNKHVGTANAVFAVVSALAVIFIVVWSCKAATARDGFLSAALGLILGGAVGNLWDRIVFGGVRDWIWVRYEGMFDWPVFNIADSCLVCGAGLLLIQAFFHAPATTENAPSQSSATSL